MKIEISPKQILIILLFIITVLLFANIMTVISRIVFDHDHLYGLVGLFNFNTERNIPTLYSSAALIFSAILLLFISYMNKISHEPYILWGVLSLIFLFLSIDETSSIHEHLTTPTRDLLDTSSFLYYAWVIPYGLFLIGFIVVYFKFLLNLPRDIMVLFLISGALFVLGAIGFEMLGGWLEELHGSSGLVYAICYTCEEFLEMLGIIIFIYSLLTYILSQKKYLEIMLVGNK